MKKDSRLLAIDDGPHARTDEHVVLVGVVTRGAQYVEGVLTGRAHVDGDDGTESVLNLVRRSRFRPLLRAILLNGIFVGGLNVVDPQRLHESTGIPVVAVVRSAPRPALVERAVLRAFADGARRWRRIRELEPVRLPGQKLWATVSGLSLREAGHLCSDLLVRGNVPEPLRLAHVIASGMVRGESRGQA